MLWDEYFSRSRSLISKDVLKEKVTYIFVSDCIFGKGKILKVITGASSYYNDVLKEKVLIFLS